MTSAPCSVSPWPHVVEQIRNGSESAVEDMYKSLRSIYFFFKREMGPDQADDAYHNLIIDLVGAIRSGAIRKPEALPAYATTIARRMVSMYLRGAIRARRTPDLEHLVLIAPSPSPEQLAARSEREAIAERILTALPPQGREILVRFYVNGESEEEIRASMGISPKGRRNNNLDGDCDRNTLNARVHPPYGIQSRANCPACSSGPLTGFG